MPLEGAVLDGGLGILAEGLKYLPIWKYWAEKNEASTKPHHPGKTAGEVRPQESNPNIALKERLGLPPPFFFMMARNRISQHAHANANHHSVQK